MRGEPILQQAVTPGIVKSGPELRLPSARVRLLRIRPSVVEACLGDTPRTCRFLYLWQNPTLRVLISHSHSQNKHCTFDFFSLLFWQPAVTAKGNGDWWLCQAKLPGPRTIQPGPAPPTPGARPVAQ